jgi:putative N-acetylmannosamine-6-phosphate epimerase
MIKIMINISRVKITSDLQTKHELASNKKRYIPHDNTYSCPSKGQNENINKYDKYNACMILNKTSKIKTLSHCSDCIASIIKRV